MNSSLERAAVNRFPPATSKTGVYCKAFGTFLYCKDDCKLCPFSHGENCKKENSNPPRGDE